MVAFLSSITSIKAKEVSPYQLLFGSKPKLPESLRSFQENRCGYEVQGKLKNRGTFCMLVEHSDYRASDVYRMLNLEIKHIRNSRDVTWVKLYHKAWIIKNTPVSNYVNDDEVGSVIPKKADDIQESHASSTTQVYKYAANLTVYSQMRRLESNFNPDALTNFKQGRDIPLDQATIAL